MQIVVNVMNSSGPFLFFNKNVQPSPAHWRQHFILCLGALAAAPPEIPCHRVVDSRGGTVAAWPRQRELLEAEGIRFRENGRLDLNRYGWELLRTAKP